MFNETSSNARGIMWALLATALFSTAAAMAKIAVNEYHVLQILFFRQLVVFASTLPSVAKSFPGSLKTSYPVIHVIRLTGAFIALSCGIWAVSVLPLSTAVTLGFAQVFFVLLLAVLFLGETVGIHRVAAVLVGFVGVIIVMRPGVEGFLDWRTLIPLAGAIGAAMAIISVRKLSASESTATLLVYQAVFVGVLAGIPLFWFWVSPDFEGLLLLLSMGVIASIGQWVGIKALRLAEASVVGNIQFMNLFFAALFGFFIFSEIPDFYTVAGAVVIVASAIYLFHRETKAKQQ